MDDLAEVWALVDAERERLGPWMPWIAGTRTIDDQRRWLQGVVADERNLEGCGIWVGQDYAGGAGLTFDQFGITGEIGYWIGSAFEGRGFVTRATRALIDIGFRELRLHRICVRAGVENARSRAIPERLGFTREGVLRGDCRGSRGFYDAVVYGLLEDEWPPP
jgi:ribosomal-protein-serine acetyltransferase